MPIEFRCSECNKLLRTGDDTAGRQAKCPECGAIMHIPSPGTESVGPPAPPTPPQDTPSGPDAQGSPFGAGAPGPSSPFDTPGGMGGPPPNDPTNPYQSPAGYAADSIHYTQSGSITPTVIAFGEIFSRTWDIFKNRIGISIGVFAIMWGVSVAVNLGATLCLGVFQVAVGDPIIAGVLNIFMQFGLWLFSVWIGIGVTICFLNIARGREVDLGDIFRGAPYLLRVLCAVIIYMLLCVFVALVCVGLPVGVVVFAMQGADIEVIVTAAILVGLLGYIPVAILSFMFMMFQYVIIDRNAGIMESLSVSMQITSGNKLTMFLIFLVAGLVACVVVICTCILPGMFLVGAYMPLLMAVMYLAMTGQMVGSDPFDGQPGTV
jgi:phage FluMu protein Com